jgi:hypothetical protein
MSLKSILSIAAWSGLALACAPRTPGANPSDMSAAQHEAMARREYGEAEAHSAKYEPSAEVRSEPCPDIVGGPVCWSSSANPTKEHLDQAEEARRRAADHRAASQALRSAEASACAGLSERDRDASPFAHREDIASVTRLNEPDPGIPAAPGYESGPLRGGRDQLAGAIVTFRALPGMTAPWLQRVIDCHLARNAALGHEVPEMPYCPLVPKGVTATVTPTSTGFAVAIRSSDLDTAKEIVRRADGLRSR